MEDDKDKVMAKKNGLRGTKIYIEEDCSVRVRQQWRELFAIAKRERAWGR